MLATDPRWLALDEIEIIKESWRWHFLDLLKQGSGDGADVTEFLGDDEDFETFIKEIEENSEQDRMIGAAKSGDWDQIDG